MNRWTLMAFVAGSLMLVSALAHALAGWPTLAATLDGTGVTTDARAALRVGWLWGSFSLAGFGLVTLSQAVRSRAGNGCDAATVTAVALSFVGFGLWALLDRNLSPHFLLFIGLGALSAGLLHPAARCQRDPAD